MKKIVCIVIVAVTFFACKEKKKKEAIEEEITAVVKPDIKLYTFSGGTVLSNKLELFSQDTTYQGQSKEFANPFYVISHPKGTLMWDAGLPEGLIASPEPITPPGGAFTISRKDSLINQLKSIGMTVDDIDYIALSHSHFDHSGHANLLKKAIWLVQDTEYDFITSDAVKNGENADLYEAIKELVNVQKLEGDFDVFEDGSVIIKSMPGHTPGHQVLYLDLPKNGPILLSGDLYHLYESRVHKTVPVFNTNVEQTLKSMEAFEDFAVEKNAKIYIQHQKEDFNKLPKAPKYLK